MEEYIGIIKMFGGTFAPRGWAFCQGQLMSIAQNQTLFSILGTTYGGDGRTTFALPDLQGRAPIGTGRGAGLQDRRLSQKVGFETTELVGNNLPSHNHIITVSESVGTIDIPVNTEEGSEDEANPGAGILANTGADNYSSESVGASIQKYGGQSLPVRVNATATASMTGNSRPFNNMQPSIAMNYIICMEGLYPPRS